MAWMTLSDTMFCFMISFVSIVSLATAAGSGVHSCFIVSGVSGFVFA